MKNALLLALIILGLYTEIFAARVQLAGVNQAGAEFAHDKLPGVLNTDYTFPQTASIDHFISKGLNVFRIPFLWERIQPALDGPLDQAYLNALTSTVNYITNKGAYAILDVHNYNAYRGSKVDGNAVAYSSLKSFWKTLATVYKDNTKVIFGLMNEPNGQSASVVLAGMQQALYGIREANAKQLILVPGTSWTGAHSWISSGNSAAIGNITDPENNIAFEMHQYLDYDYSGRNADCKADWSTTAIMDGATNWLRTKGFKGFLGEFGWGNNAHCNEIAESFLSYLDTNSDVWLGWTYWSAGPWWGDYMFTVEPNNGVDKPQAALLYKHLPTGVTGGTTQTTAGGTTTTTVGGTTTTTVGGTTTTTASGTQTQTQTNTNQTTEDNPEDDADNMALGTSPSVLLAVFACVALFVNAHM